MIQRVWMVTGCSSGFGEQFIKTILERGDHAIATARRLQSIDHLKMLGAKTLQLDVSASDSDLKQKVEEAVSIYNRIDVFVANAGYGQYGPIEEISLDDLQRAFQTNVFGTISILQALMSHWRIQQSGHLVVNSSMLSWQVNPCWGAYSATKAALDRLIQAFAQESAITAPGVKTLVFNPGFFRTPITNADKCNYPKDSKHYQQLSDMYRGLSDSMEGKQPGDPGKLVKIVVDIVRGEGVAKGRDVPDFLPFGRDAVESITGFTETMKNAWREWQDVILSTDFDDGRNVNAAVLSVADGVHGNGVELSGH